MTAYQDLRERLNFESHTWLVTGAAGFVGSNLVEALLALNQTVRGLDNFATGHRKNLDEVKQKVTEQQWERFSFLEGDIRDPNVCRAACDSIEFVLHQAALGSVPRSIADPITSHQVNVDGTVNMLIAARDHGVRSFVYASSSSVYGDHPALPKVEANIGRALSPYAVTKRADELYAEVFRRCYRLPTLGLRYFNVFGERQDPDGPYAAVIPKWIKALMRGTGVTIHGDGETSRDFCYIANVVEANLLGAMTAPRLSEHHAYNIAVGEKTSLNQLFAIVCDALRAENALAVEGGDPVYSAFREGDVRHSLADIAAAATDLGYAPAFRVEAGLRKAIGWYVESERKVART